MNCEEWVKIWFELYAQELAPKTIESYRRLWALVAPELAKTPVDAISPDQVQYALLRVSRDSGARQAQLAYCFLSGVFRRAVRSRHIASNPVEALDKPRHESAPGRAITVTDWVTLKPIIDDYLPYALMTYAGLRRGELLALRRGDIGPDVVRVRLQRVRVGGRLEERPPKSRAGVRDVPILPPLAAALDAAPLMHPRALVCPIAPETLAHRWRRDQAEAGITTPYRLHDLRHTYATRLVLAGCNLRVLQYMIGHSSFDLTAGTYAHIDAGSAVNECLRLCFK